MRRSRIVDMEIAMTPKNVEKLQKAIAALREDLADIDDRIAELEDQKDPIEEEIEDDFEVELANA
jgi:predicted  nucleic acid-binding Zn-ribbon protein